jgi:hypothetical protein
MRPPCTLTAARARSISFMSSAVSTSLVSFDVLLKVLDLAGSGNRDDERLLGQEPCDRKLRCCCVPPFRKLRDAINKESLSFVRFARRSAAIRCGTECSVIVYSVRVGRLEPRGCAGHRRGEVLVSGVREPTPADTDVLSSVPARWGLRSPTTWQSTCFPKQRAIRAHTGCNRAVWTVRID